MPYKSIFEQSKTPEITKEEGSYRSIFRDGGQNIALTEENKLPEFLGGGSYTSFIGEPNRIVKTPAEYGLVPTETGEEGHHIFPISLGGLSEKYNFKALDKKDHARITEVGNKSLNDYKQGKISLPQARINVLSELQTIIDEKQGVKQGTLANLWAGVKEVFNNPLKSIKEIATELPQTRQAVKDVWESGKTRVDNTMIQDTVKDFAHSLVETSAEEWTRLVNLFPKAGETVGIYQTEKTKEKSRKVGQALEAGVGGVGVLLSPITAVFEASKNLPIIGSIAGIINLPLAFIGDVLTNLSNEGLNSLVAGGIMEKETADNVRQGINEVANLAGQIVVAGKMFKGKELKNKKAELATKYGEKDAETILKVAEKRAELEIEVKQAEKKKKYQPIEIKKPVVKEKFKIPEEPEPLTKEIQKAKASGKSFEEFVSNLEKNKNIVFHGTTKEFERFDSTIKKELGRLLGEGTYFSRNKKTPLNIARDKGRVLYSDISNKKLFNLREDVWKTGKNDKIIFDVPIDVLKTAKKYNIKSSKEFALIEDKNLVNKIIKEAGYDGVESNGNILIFNASDIIPKTKSQLKELWEQGVKGAEKVKMEKPIEYKPIEERAPMEPSGIKTAGIAKSIEAKAIERGLVKDGYERLAEFTGTTMKEQARAVEEMIKTDFEKFRKVIRSEDALPEGVNGISAVKGMEEVIKKTKDIDIANELAYELANSPLTTKVSEAAQELSLTRGRKPDSYSAQIQKIKKARKKRAEQELKRKPELKDKAKKEIKKNNLAKEDLMWENFLKKIEC